jgi:hypothetical protein
MRSTRPSWRASCSSARSRHSSPTSRWRGESRSDLLSVEECIRCSWTTMRALPRSWQPMGSELACARGDFVATGEFPPLATGNTPSFPDACRGDPRPNPSTRPLQRTAAAPNAAKPSRETP